MATNLPLPLFFAQTLNSLAPIFDDTLSLSSSEAQSTLTSALDSLYLIQRMIDSLGVFSENEGVDEISERELVFMSVRWVIGATEEKGGLGGRDDRVSTLRRAEAAYNSFLELITSYGVLSPEEQAGSSAAASGSAPRDPAQKREAKIRQYKREKELREKISASTRDQPEPSSSPIAFLLSLLPQTSNRPAVTSTSSGYTSVNPEESPEISRSAILLVLRLLHTLTLSALSSIAMELDLLASAPASISPIPEPTSDSRQSSRGAEDEEDNSWRLDRRPGAYRPRELVSGGGRVLRPFTILPSTQALSDRERLKGEVFRQSWRLPTMTIDEYLEEEQRRGNIITGGGQASYDAPTESELLELAAEDDGTVLGYEKAEQKRLKDEKWAQYTDENKKGAGNTMNKG
ncbi:hypothetical protein I317_04327 [Kwoniella heveanensis CBS 569]|uniref:CNA03170 n=1 Tax=Kwoniella heveanensis TaxID=89924 RepID=D2KCD7_9TREE|nr:CNA03170 [Kwoniella heveanensis]OCF41817.1 hypothetical protein I317_04327 [Kwoniella heveanensis CBS 569]